MRTCESLQKLLTRLVGALEGRESAHGMMQTRMEFTENAGDAAEGKEAETRTQVHFFSLHNYEFINMATATY